MRIVKAGGADPISLGLQGEKNATRVEFPLADYIKTFGDGVSRLTVRRAGDPKEYAAALERVGDTAVWVVGDEWTQYAGHGSCQLSWYVGDDTVAKSTKILRTRVQEAMGTSDETAPEPQAGYLAQVQAVGAKVEVAERTVVAAAAEVAETARRFDVVAEDTMANMEQTEQRVSAAAERAEGFAAHAPTVGDNGNWWVWNGEGYEDTGLAVAEGSEGEAGGYYTPRVTQPSSATMRVEFSPSKENMPTAPGVTIDLPAGPAGQPGQDGKDGQNGKDGAQGPAGADGKTPVRGVDYYTEADKQEMVNLVLAALPNGDEVSY